MEFGVSVTTGINDWQLIRYAETLGYDGVWAGLADDLVRLLRPVVTGRPHHAQQARHRCKFFVLRAFERVAGLRVVMRIPTQWRGCRGVRNAGGCS